MRNLIQATILTWALAFVYVPTSHAQSEFTWTTSENVFAIGDVHGDLIALKTILFHMGLIDGQGNWTGRQQQLVQMGDFVDKGPQSAETMFFLRDLQLQARAVGGKVTVLLGNHEMMEISGDSRVSHPNDLYAFPLVTDSSDEMDGLFFGVQRRFLQWLFWGQMSWDEEKRLRLANYVHHLRYSEPLSQWFLDLPAIIRINGNLFVHGGIENWVEDHSIEEINAMVREWVAFYQGRTISAPDKSTRWVIGKDGPLWTETLGRETKKLLTMERRHLYHEALLENLAKYSADRIVVGHSTVRPEQAMKHPVFDDTVIRTDTSISVYHAPLQTLSYYVFQGDSVRQVVVPLSETQRFVAPNEVYDNDVGQVGSPLNDCIDSVL